MLMNQDAGLPPVYLVDSVWTLWGGGRVGGRRWGWGRLPRVVFGSEHPPAARMRAPGFSGYLGLAMERGGGGLE